MENSTLQQPETPKAYIKDGYGYLLELLSNTPLESKPDKMRQIVLEKEYRCRLKVKKISNKFYLYKIR